MKSLLNQNGGFTLVELLIVVAIIGVLATVGVPTYRLMVQRAKKSEAKVALGGLYTAETAFQAEYGVYGNSLEKVGFELEGPAAGRYYVVGFPTAVCANPAAIHPAIANPAGVALNNKYAAYYTAAPVFLYASGKMPGACEVGTVPADGSTFTATASGLISPKFAAGSTSIDGWTIDNNRTLSNTKDGAL